MKFFKFIISIAIGFLAGYFLNTRKKFKADILYITPDESFKKEIAKKGFTLTDATDEAHPYRVEIIYPENKENEYYTLLEKYGVSDKSPKYLKQKAKNR